MSGGQDRTALEQTGARLGEMLRRALSGRLAERRQRDTTEGRRTDMRGPAPHEPGVERDERGDGDRP